MPEALLQWAQLAVSLITLAGMAFALGRVFERIDALKAGQQEIKQAIFGESGNDGIFARRSEVTMLTDALDRRIDDLHERLGAARPGR